MRVTLKDTLLVPPARRAGQGEQIRGCKPRSNAVRFASADLLALRTPAAGRRRPSSAV
jgi:hypothetical protein